jgi:hypothetical protein
MMLTSLAEFAHGTVDPAVAGRQGGLSGSGAGGQATGGNNGGSQTGGEY